MFSNRNPRARTPLLRRIVTAVVALGLTAGLLSVAPAADAASGAAQLKITNLDGQPANNRVFLSKIEIPADSAETMHKTATIRLTNTGATSLSVRSLRTTGTFQLSAPSAAPFTLAKGRSIDLTVTFTATSGSWHTGKALIGWKNTKNRTTSVALVGWWQKLSEHSMEPRLDALVKNLGYKTKMPSRIYSAGARQKFSADEVITNFWTARNSTKPVKITQLAAWRGYPSDLTVGRYTKGKPGAVSTVFRGNRVDAQTAIPRGADGRRATATFSGKGAFGLKIDHEYSEARLNDQAVDRRAGCRASVCGQHLRVFKVRNAMGKIVAGRYLVSMDFGGVNYDYNDNVFLIDNVKPTS